MQLLAACNLFILLYISTEMELVLGFFWLNWNHIRVWLIFQHLKISMSHLMRKCTIVRRVVCMLLKCLKGEKLAIIVSFGVNMMHFMWFIYVLDKFLGRRRHFCLHFKSQIVARHRCLGQKGRRGGEWHLAQRNSVIGVIHFLLLFVRL
jgi:hypothetical protein